MYVYIEYNTNIQYLCDNGGSKHARGGPLCAKLTIYLMAIAAPTARAGTTDHCETRGGCVRSSTAHRSHKNVPGAGPARSGAARHGTAQHTRGGEGGRSEHTCLRCGCDGRSGSDPN